MLSKIASQLAHSAFREQLLWLYLLSEDMSDVILGNDELKLNEIPLISNQNVSDKTNSNSENLTKIEISFDFYRFLTSHTGHKGALVHVYLKSDLWVRLFEHVR